MIEQYSNKGGAPGNKLRDEGDRDDDGEAERDADKADSPPPPSDTADRGREAPGDGGCRIVVGPLPVF